MLTSLQIGNFKAFAKSQRVPIKPITLIYGANSSGKSSIIQSVILARHAMEAGELDIQRTNIGGESVDLGGFRQYVHRREANRQVEWSAELNASGFEGRLAELLVNIEILKVTLSIGISLDDQDRPIQGAVPEVATYEIFADGNSLLRMSRRKDGKLKLDRLEHEHPIFREVLKAIVETSTTTESIKPSDYEGLDEVISGIVPEITASTQGFIPMKLLRSDVLSSGEQITLFPVSRGHRMEDLATAVKFFIPRTIDDLIQGVGETVSRELSRLQYLGPLRSYPPRHFAFSQHHDPNWFAGGGYAWDVVRRDENVRNAVNNWLSSADRLQTPYKLTIRDLIGIDQIEEPILEGLERINEEGLDIEHEPDSEYTLGGAWPVIEDIEAEALRFQELIRSCDIEKLNELILLDQRSNTVVSHRDVGIGISQVLPVLVSAYANKNAIVAIEQPEIHLHPALQAELGDVFIESALGGSENKFIIETHSEHLILRILRRIRETTRGKNNGMHAIRPEDIALLFVSGTKKGSTVQELRVDERGRLIDQSPGGFFEEDFEELF